MQLNFNTVYFLVPIMCTITAIACGCAVELASNPVNTVTFPVPIKCERAVEYEATQ